MLGGTCTVGSLDDSEGMKRVIEWYPNRTANYLADVIQAWREKDARRSSDSYPVRKHAFDLFLRKYEKLIRASQHSTKTRDQVLNEHNSIHGTYKQAELRRRAQLISDIFSCYVTEKCSDEKISEKDTNNRQKAIEELGGPMGIFDAIKDEIVDAVDKSFWLEAYSEREDKEALADYLAKEYKKILDNFDALVMRSVEYIKFNEDISIDSVSPLVSGKKL